MTSATTDRPRRSSRDRRRVLLVEDSKGDADLVEAMLDEVPIPTGFDMSRVSSLDEARRVLASLIVDAVLLDLNLSDSTGLATLSAIRAAAKGTPIVVLSGGVDEGSRAQMLAAGADDVFSKHETKGRLFARNVLAIVERSGARAQQRQMEALVEAIPEGVLVVGLTGVVRHVNRAALALFDVERDDFVGELLGFSVRDREPVDVTIRRRGGDRTCEIRVAPVEWHGEAAILAVLRDVTELRATQQQLIANDRLVSLGTLAAGVAHEVNNPLAAVIASLGILAKDTRPFVTRGDLPADVLEYIEGARDAAERIRWIVRDLKTFVRVEDESRAALDVRRVLDAAIRMSAHEVQRRATLERAYGEVPEILGNDARLCQVFLNLLVNAAQALPEDAAAPQTIRVVTRIGPPGFVEVDVIDSGMGIPLHVQPKIFAPFFTTKPAGTGTGLGLSICQQIVTSLGGTISFETAPGRGTTFTVRLPVALEPAKAVPSVPPAATTARRGRVLVIDDDAMIGKVLSRVLSREHTVTFVGTAPAALERLDRGEVFDVVLCDMNMPGMGGMAFARSLEARFPAYAERLVLVTGGAMDAEAREFLDRASYPRIEKPFDTTGVSALVASLLRR